MIIICEYWKKLNLTYINNNQIFFTKVATLKFSENMTYYDDDIYDDIYENVSRKANKRHRKKMNKNVRKEKSLKKHREFERLYEIHAPIKINALTTPGIISQIASHLKPTDNAISSLFMLINSQHYRDEMKPFVENLQSEKKRKEEEEEMMSMLLQLPKNLDDFINICSISGIFDARIIIIGCFECLCDVIKNLEKYPNIMEDVENCKFIIRNQESDYVFRIYDSYNRTINQLLDRTSIAYLEDDDLFEFRTHMETCRIRLQPYNI